VTDSAWRQLVDCLHDGADPYAGFEPDGWGNGADAWDSHHEWFDAAVRELRPRVIVEVGSFLGASARHFAAALRERQVDGAVVCVDTWLGESVLWNSPEWRPHLRHRHGRPTTYEAFLANALESGLDGYLVPQPLDSRAGARYLASRNVTAQVVYVDGSHEQGDVYADLALYWELLAPGGVLLADDYQPVVFPGVVADVDRFASERHLAVETLGLKARLRKERR
jgi:hypothetical protein